MFGSFGRKSDSAEDWAYGPQLVQAATIVAACFVLFQPTLRSITFGVDSKAVWSGASGLLSVGDPYAGGSAIYPFVYPPSSALLFLPFALISAKAFTVGMLVVDQLVLIVLGYGYARVAGIRATSWWATGVVLLLLLSPLGVNSASLGNASILVATMGLWSLIFASEKRWYAAAVLLGVAVAIKPLVVFVAIVFIVRRAIRPLGVAVAIPVLLNIAVLPFVRDPGNFLSQVMPHLLSGALARPDLNASVWARGSAIDASSAVILLVRAGIVVLGCVGVWVWRHADDLQGYVMLSTVPAVALFLVVRVDEPHFNLVTLGMCVVLLGSSRGWARIAAVAITVSLLYSSRPHVADLTAIAQLASLGWTIVLGTGFRRRRVARGAGRSARRDDAAMVGSAE